MLIPFDKGELVAHFSKNAHVVSISYEIEGTKLSLECNKADFIKYNKHVIHA